MKKVVTLLTVILLMICAAVSVSAKDYVATENDTYYIAKEEATVENAQLLSASVQLATPKNLVWNPDSQYGWIQWDAVDNCEGEYMIYVYCDGEEVAEMDWFGVYDHDGSGVVGVELIVDEIFTKNGKYTFAVQAIGDYENYSDSELGYSGEYNFVCPAKKLATPTNVRWDESGVIVHDAVANAGGYLYTVYNQEGWDVGGSWHVHPYPMEYEGEIREDLSDYLIEIAGWEEDFEVAYVTVKALTYNVEEYLNSDESAYSEGYEIGEIGTSVTGILENLINDMYDYGESAEDTLDYFLGYMWETDTTNVDLALSMQQDEDLVDMIAELEGAYAEETGVEVSIYDECYDTSYLEERGIDVNKVEIVGAALNSADGNDVSLNFSEADDSISLDDLYYKNSVAVDISMDGVYDNQALDIPVQITMPVPTGVVPDRLVILHYHQDGSVEEIHPAVSYVDDKPYVTFVLTSFSTFVFCNVDDEAVICVCVQDEYWTELTGEDYDGVVIGALYNSDGDLLEVQTCEAYIGEYEDLYFDFENVSQDDYVKIMWWNSLVDMKSVCEYEPIFFE